jgi:hypothetical protein
MYCHRYITPALTGRWHPSVEEALEAALTAGQAVRRGQAIVLREFAELQSSWLADPGNRNGSHS